MIPFTPKNNNIKVRYINNHSDYVSKPIIIKYEVEQRVVAKKVEQPLPKRTSNTSNGNMFSLSARLRIAAMKAHSSGFARESGR